jgi:hypothetical protein
VTFSGGPHQRRLPVLLVLAVHSGAARDERLDRRQRADARRRHQRGLTAGQRGVRIGAGLQQRLDHRAVAVGNGQRERSDAVAVRRLDIGAGAKEQFDALEIVPVGGPVQRRHPIDLRRVDVGAALQERADRRAVHLLHRVGQRRVGRGGGREADSGEEKR